MKATVFMPPNGRRAEIFVTDIRNEDREFFEQHNIKISMEEVGGQNVIYADTGHVTEDGEPDELLVFADGRSCSISMQALREACEKRLNKDAD